MSTRKPKPMMRTPDASILDYVMEGCQVLGPDYRYLYLNDAAVEHSRRRREDLLGRRNVDAYPGSEDTEMFALPQRCIEEGVPAEVENEFIYPDAANGWFALKMERIPEGVFIFSIDVSERRRAELALHAQLRRIEVLRDID